YFCKGENMVGEHANALFRTASQPICRRGTVHREQSIIALVPPVGGDRPRQPRFLPEAACFVDSRYPVLAPDSSDNERIEEIGLSVKNAWPQASNQRPESLNVLAKPIVQMNFVPPRAGQNMVVDALEGVLTAVVAIRLIDTRLRNDRDAKPLAYLSHSSVLRPQGIAGLSHRQYTSHYVQNRACRIKGASRRKLGVRSFRLCENLDLATQLLQRLPIRNPTSLTADSAHNEQRELPVSDTSVVLVQVAQRRQTLRAEKVELLDQRSQLQQ